MCCAITLTENDHLDLIAVAPHPDDVEIGCGGTLAKMVKLGYRVGIVDLTDGEPTPLNASPEERLEEAKNAAEILGVQKRITLDLPNRRLFDNFESRCALASVFRKYKPRVVLGIYGKTVGASPDHEQAQYITEAAIFYSRLTKWEEYFDLPPWTISRLYYWSLRGEFQGGSGTLFAVDISSEFDIKTRAVSSYQSQFGGKALENREARIHEWLASVSAHAARKVGRRIQYAELFLSPSILSLEDLMQFTPPR